MGNKSIQRFWDYLIAGLIVLLPFWVSIYIIIITFRLIDNILRKPLEIILGFNIPTGTSFIVTIFLIFLMGFFVRHALGNRIYNYIECKLLMVPWFNSIYSTFKEVVNAILLREERGFKGVVLVEYPRKGVYTLGFSTGANIEEVWEKTGENLVNVFVPTSPNPTSGYVLMFKETEVIKLKMPVEEGIKTIISGGFSRRNNK